MYYLLFIIYYLFTLIKMKRFLILLAIVALASSQDWDYRKAGRDWTNNQCKS